jgi:hypothetical protein
MTSRLSLIQMTRVQSRVGLHCTVPRSYLQERRIKLGHLPEAFEQAMRTVFFTLKTVH